VDIFNIIQSCMVVFALAESIVVHVLLKTQRDRMAIQIDKVHHDDHTSPSLPPPSYAHHPASPIWLAGAACGHPRVALSIGDRLDAALGL
jgi:hypothetical protein